MFWEIHMKNNQTIIVYKESGFTLIEILVTIILFGILGTIATQSLFSLLRGASKSEAVKEVKQNGDYALSFMEIKIRNGTIDDVNCTGVTTSLTINNPNSSPAPTTTFDCFTDGSVNRLRQDSSDYLTNTSVTLDDCSNTNISFICADTNGVKNVLIKFTLRRMGDSLGEAESAAQTFQTQVTLRNK